MIQKGLHGLSQERGKILIDNNRRALSIFIR